MILDLERSVRPDANFDVCLVGAGAAGLFLAMQLVKHGKRVLVLEAGGMRRFERRSQALKKSDIAGLPFNGAHSGRFRTLGGSTAAWPGQIMELDEIDFTHRPWVLGSGWPLKKSDLTAFYRHAIAFEGLAQSILEDRDIWTERRYQPPHIGDDLTFAFSRYCPVRQFAVLCENALNTHPDLIVYLHANVCQLEMAEDGETVTSVHCRTLTGRTTCFCADRFVLCMGGIETSRFLLQPSAFVLNGTSRWTPSELVGRYFQDHIHCFAADIVGAKFGENWHYGPDRINIHNYLYLPKIKLSPAAQERYGVLNANGMAEYEDGVYRALRTAALIIAGPASAITIRDLAHLVSRLPAVLWYRFRNETVPNFVLPTAKLKLSVYSEQSPLSQSRITLTDKRDALGLYRARIDWKVSAQEVATVRRYVRVAQKVFEQRGLARIVPDPDLFNDGIERKFKDTYHHMGGTRMATSASNGVVDTDLRLYETRNVYVCSTSVFPTSGFANPTHTLLALAARLAEHLASLPTRRRGLVMPRCDTGTMNLPLAEIATEIADPSMPKP